MVYVRADGDLRTHVGSSTSARGLAYMRAKLKLFECVRKENQYRVHSSQYTFSVYERASDGRSRYLFTGETVASNSYSYEALCCIFTCWIC